MRIFNAINNDMVSMRCNFGAINSDTEKRYGAINHNTVSMRCMFRAIKNDTDLGNHYQSIIVLMHGMS